MTKNPGFGNITINRGVISLTSEHFLYVFNLHRIHKVAQNIVIEIVVDRIVENIVNGRKEFFQIFGY